jgi:small conductance mechanosensitive channel
MEDIMQTMLEAVSGWGLKVIGALGVLVLGLWVARIVRATSRRLMIRSGVDGAVANLVGNVIYFGTISLVGIAVLGGFGIKTHRSLPFSAPRALRLAWRFRDPCQTSHRV